MYLRDFVALNTCEQILMIANFFVVLTAICMALAGGIILPCYLIGGKVCVLNRYGDMDKYKECDCEHWNKTYEKEKRYEKPSERQRLAPVVAEKTYPIVSILTPLWTDSNESMLSCTGVIVSNDTLLTSSSCKNYIGDLKRIKIRSNSKLWAKAGDLHSALEMSQPHPSVIFIKVQPQFKVPPLDLPPITWRKARKIYFPTGMYEKSNSGLRRKYGTYIGEDWTTHPCYRVKPIPCKFTADAVLDKFFISCNKLVGMAGITGDLNAEIFLDFFQPEIINVLKEVKNVSKRKSIEQKKNCSIIYLDRCVQPKTRSEC